MYILNAMKHFQACKSIILQGFSLDLGFQHPLRMHVFLTNVSTMLVTATANTIHIKRYLFVCPSAYTSSLCQRQGPMLKLLLQKKLHSLF